jgi:uncharacterized protein
MHIYTLPQEIEVWYIIPAVRREMARLLTKEHGLSYDNAGKALGVSKAAISQYNKNKRASKVTLHENVMREIEKSAKRISKNGDVSVKEMLRVLRFMRDKKLSFEFCKSGRLIDEECQDIKIAYESYWN